MFKKHILTGLYTIRDYFINDEYAEKTSANVPVMSQEILLDNILFYWKKILKQKIGNQQITCLEEDEPDRYQRILAECFVYSENLSKFLVRNGYAFAYRKYSAKFVKDEEFAKDNKLGIWAMTFQYPWDFRNPSWKTFEYI